VADAGAGDGDEPTRGDPSWGCIEADDEASAAEFFAHAGVPGYREPALGYHAVLCSDASAGANAAICELGVAGLATHVLPECVIDAG
jgi:hypothetical protein